MKTAVIFAASIFDPARLDIIHDFFTVFKEHFADADFFVGINYGSIPSLESEIEKYGLCCSFCRSNGEKLYTKTDASAYQAALLLLKVKSEESNKSYDIYWFGHTKGGVNSRPVERQMYLDDMFKKRKEIEGLFEKYPLLGSWGIRGNARNSCGVWWKDYNVDLGIPICGNVKIPPFNYTHVNWSYIETLYVLKKEPVEAYLKALPFEFFNTKLNPWYFETVMPWVPSRCGYFPYVKTPRCFWDVDDLPNITKKWIEENNLTEQMSYLNI